MGHKVKNWVSKLFDYSSSKNYTIFFSIIAVVTIVISKYMGLKNSMVILVSATVITVFGLVFQVFRREKNIKNLLYYLFASMFTSFITYMVYLMTNNYAKNNINMTMRIVKVMLIGIALSVDLLGSIYLSNKSNPRNKKYIIAAAMIYISIVAVVATVFLTSRASSIM